jgi:hypothetical protein
MQLIAQGISGDALQKMRAQKNTEQPSAQKVDCHVDRLLIDFFQNHDPLNP